MPREEMRGPKGGRLDWHQMTVRITEAQWRALNAIAQKKGVPPTTQVQKLVMDYIAVETKDGRKP